MGALDRSAMRRRPGKWFLKNPQLLTFVDNLKLGAAA
jgi:hypothetical protein